MRIKYTLVFELPDMLPGMLMRTMDMLGQEIEEAMDARYPGLYMDVMWNGKEVITNPVSA